MPIRPDRIDRFIAKKEDIVIRYPMKVRTTIKEFDHMVLEDGRKGTVVERVGDLYARRLENYRN